MNEIFSHYSVMHRNVISSCREHIHSEFPSFWDGTAGEGGHSLLIQKEFQNAEILLTDRDPVMLERARLRLREYADRCRFVNINFSDYTPEYSEKFDCILLDLGISMYHLKGSERGFSFQGEEELNMNLDGEYDETAADILNRYRKEELEKIIKEFGEESWASKIAETIVTERKKKKFSTNADLADLIYRTIPRKFHSKGIHPATKTFQALRIHVNRELEHIEKAVLKMPEYLKENGILTVISFHSLEDRIIKQKFKEQEKLGHYKIITKKPVTPSDAELKENPASRSAKMRVLKKTAQE
ncbi:MAG TPA: 16S rRNA (cytosine(1402)-N(4))-methyltransferase RsmH [Leptospiraceae bacterium]|nr:16S rRNA (cytosine(1402)-N(4))-methyltransferase RsmH [Leptospiraceae bacterium]